MTVYVVNRLGTKIDLSSALVYGDVEHINSKYVFSDELDVDGGLPIGVLNNLERVVDKYEPDYDYLLIAGDHLQLVAMSAMLAVRWGMFKVLRYDREAGGYAVAVINTIHDE